MNTYARVESDLRSTWTLADIARVAKLLWRNIIFLSIAVLLGLSVMFISIVVSGPSYEISAKLLVRLGREMMAPALVDARDAGQSQQLTKRPEDLASEVEIFTDPRLVERTVESFGPDFFLADDPPHSLYQHVKYAAKTLRRWINDQTRQALIFVGLRSDTTPLERLTLSIAQGLAVEVVRKSDVIQISMHFPDPKIGELFLNHFIAFGMDSHIEAYRTAGEREFFQNEREEQGAELRRAESQLLDARSNRDAIYSGAERFAALLKAQAETQQQLDATSTDVADNRAQIAYAAQALKIIPAEIMQSTTQSRQKSGDDVAGRLNQLQVDLTKLRATYSEEAPEIKDAQLQIGTLRNLQEEQSRFRVDGTTSGPNPQYSALARDLTVKQGLLEGQIARAAALTSQIARLHDQARSAQLLEIEIAQTERRVAELRRSIDVYDKAFEDARLAETMNAVALSNLKVIMPATSELVPSSPSIGRSLIIGVVGSLTLAIGFILIRDWRQSTVFEGLA